MGCLLNGLLCLLVSLFSAWWFISKCIFQLCIVLESNRWYFGVRCNKAIYFHGNIMNDVSCKG